MMKLLITARDPATAVSFERLIPELLISEEFQIRVLCQEPAFQILQPLVDSKDIWNVPKDEFTEVLEDDFLRHQFDDFQPDAVLTGISGPDTGIDEAVLHYAMVLGIHSYALQSFWGDMNQASGALPKTAFVMDDEAVRITQERYPAIENVAIGSIKHIDYRLYDPLAARAKKRPGLVDSDTDQVILGFYGQPILEITGYFETIEALTRQLSQWKRSFKLMYRPHPKETEELKYKTSQLFSDAFGSRFVEDPFGDIKDSLVVCDLVLSAFSTCCFDNLYLNEIAPQPFNASVYLWFEPELIRWWQEYSHLKEMPLISEELLLSVDKEEEMLSILEQGLLKETQKALWEKAKAHLPSPESSIRIMMEKIVSDFNNKK